MGEEGRYLVLGTAGHIDHGKTTLVKALTGIDCDSLEEEKARGITIDIGIAHWNLPDGTQLGIVDMPGHRRFIRNMVAGAIGIDIVMLVIAADDGVMPQTREHLHIARLLGVRHGLVALTKVDMVDAELRELAEADVEELIEGTFLAGCPIVPVAATAGIGLTELTDAVMAVAAQVAPRTLGDRFRMPIDRSFSIKGAGTVVTGTTLAGTINIDDEVEIMPRGRRVRVRGIQVHGASVKQAGPGYRAALNLAGIDKEDVQRGDVLVTPDSLATTFMFDAEVELLSEPYRPLRRGTEVLVHIGTTEVTAKLFPLEGEVLTPGETSLVQMRVSQELAVAVGDRMIVRDSSSEHTIGGGRVLDAHPTKHSRQRQKAADSLDELRGTDAVAALLHEVGKTPFGLERRKALRLLHLSDNGLDTAQEAARQSGAGLRVHPVGSQQVLTLPANRERIVISAVKALTAYHAANPLTRQGLNAKGLAKAIDKTGEGVPVEVLGPTLDEAVKKGTLLSLDGTYAVSRTDITLSARDRKAIEIITATLNASATPEQPESILEELPVDRKRMRQLLEYLLEAGEIVTHSKMYFGRQTVERARTALLDYFAKQERMTVSEFGQAVGSSRRYSVPFLNYFEAVGFLKRVGNDRILNPDWQSPEVPSTDENTDG